MHEVSIAESLIGLITDEAVRQKFSRVMRVKVKLGALGHVEPDALLFCFGAVAEGSVAEGAVLDLDVVAGNGWCDVCAVATSMEERYDLCAVCGNPLRLIAGDELRLVELEVE